jgi:hypothetical protein
MPISASYGSSESGAGGVRKRVESPDQATAGRMRQISSLCASPAGTALPAAILIATKYLLFRGQDRTSLR